MMDSMTENLMWALECPVCLEQLDATARVLPCQHTFCRRCLLEIVHSRPQLLCPECRVQCDQSVDDLPSNILLIRLLEGIKGSRKQSTDNNNRPLLPPYGSHPNVGGVGVVGTGQQPMTGPSMSQTLNLQKIISHSAPHLESNTNQTQLVPPPPPPQLHQQQPQPILQSQQQCLVKQLVPNTLIGHKTVFNYDGKQLEGYVALYNYRPQKKDELELKKEELYLVIDKYHDGWFKGVSVINGSSGVFPGNYVQLAKLTKPMSQYASPTIPTVANPTIKSQCHIISANNSLVKSTQFSPKDPPVPKPKPIIYAKPSLPLPSTPMTTATTTSVMTTNSAVSPQPTSSSSLQSGVVTATTAHTDNVIVYARPRPTAGQPPIYDASRSPLSALVPPPPAPSQRPTRPLSSIVVPNTKPMDDHNNGHNGHSPQTQLAHQMNQSLIISKQKSASQSSLDQSTQWHQPKVAATRNMISMATNTSTAAITPPPNVSVMSSSGVSMTPTSHRPSNDLRLPKPKEKSNFIKRFTSSAKPKRKNQTNSNNNKIANNNHNNSFSCDNPSFVDTSPNSVQQQQTLHIRSGSCPNQSLPDLSSHKKQSSLDDTNTVIKNRLTKSVVKESSPPQQQPHQQQSQQQQPPPQVPQPIAPPLVRERYRCVVPYPPNSEYELELQVGDVVYVHKKRDDGWYKGTLQRTGKTGLFPGPFVDIF